ncbi:unnamed protein product [Tilletia controversa]|uniref:Uncharacterized protein n=3 Tax=Tilletia TaxID=13289 RepID=A0A8X7SUY6_9BASI|nr:hypothetical protein CF328_g5418 [Tilletia controversa]KAE8195770.1 hypothetical protein CF335_g5014 [Tilletia laevis]KAE8265019.1 hypothetical protein A4X03_0g534 [Tilletia caries]KAE8196251.1 hypothetical protein CF336_g2714 [Tilletia laevis]KAE8243470.1 hypothetical protein A4X06_0g6291 [Tilletia controversa]
MASKRQPIAILQAPDANTPTTEQRTTSRALPDQDRYEYDVLYENQRGVLWFGTPKFSPSTLLQWDPSPWSDIDHRNSPYNIVTAQLPDDSWEWVYPEWMIDMTGDTDEGGWQYAGSFGQRFIPLLAGPFQLLLGGGGSARAKAEAERRRRRAERMEKRTERAKRNAETRADEGIEALKRSAKARRAKWRGRPDGNCFVRRRRWIRLRRKKVDGESYEDQR